MHILRPMEDSDWSFVTNSFLKSIRKTCDDLKNIENTKFFPMMQRKLEAACERYGCYIACNPQFPEHIVGYYIGNESELFFAFVKFPLRKKSVFSFMLSEVAGVKEVYKLDYCFKTFASERMHDKPYLELTHNSLIG